MKLTDQQRAAVKTWRKGLNGSILGYLPFTETDKPMDSESQAAFGGKYEVAAYLSDPVMDFILAATHAAAEGTE